MLSYFNYFFGHLRNINLYISPTVKDVFRYRRQEDVWVSRGYCNKPLQAWWRKTTEMYSLTVLEARGLRSEAVHEDLCVPIPPFRRIPVILD